MKTYIKMLVKGGSAPSHTSASVTEPKVANDYGIFLCNGTLKQPVALKKSVYY